MFNADPHPGNYLFSDGGVVTFLDYGCVQPIPAANHELAHAVHRAALARDEAGFREAGKKLLGTKPGPLEALVLRYLRRCFEPLFVSPFRMTREYAASLVSDFKDMSSAAFKMDAQHTFPMPTEILFMNRLQFGFYFAPPAMAPRAASQQRARGELDGTFFVDTAERPSGPVRKKWSAPTTPGVVEFVFNAADVRGGYDATRRSLTVE